MQVSDPESKRKNKNNVKVVKTENIWNKIKGASLSFRTFKNKKSRKSGKSTKKLINIKIKKSGKIRKYLDQDQGCKFLIQNQNV